MPSRERVYLVTHLDEIFATTRFSMSRAVQILEENSNVTHPVKYGRLPTPNSAEQSLPRMRHVYKNRAAVLQNWRILHPHMYVFESMQNLVVCIPQLSRGSSPTLGRGSVLDSHVPFKIVLQMHTFVVGRVRHNISIKLRIVPQNEAHLTLDSRLLLIYLRHA